jgi:hypothetical protein
VPYSVERPLVRIAAVCGLLTMRTTRRVSQSTASTASRLQVMPHSHYAGSITINSAKRGTVFFVSPPPIVLSIRLLHRADYRRTWHRGEHGRATILKPTNAHKCMKVYCTHCMPPTCFGHSCGHLQGDALQRIHTSKGYRSLWNQ